MPSSVVFLPKKAPAKYWFSWASVGVVLIVLAVTLVISWLLYQYTVNLLTQRLRDRLVAIVRTAAVEFDARDLRELQTENDYHKPQWPIVVGQLHRIRANNPDVVFAYIVRRAADDPTKIVFVADADSLDPFAKIDLNHDGKIDDADALVTPGTIYKDVPQDVFGGFLAPVANQQLYQDQWGWLISGYAPIHDENGLTEAVVAVDIRADNFFQLTRQTFYPFLAFILFLAAIIAAQALMLAKLSRAQIRQLQEVDRQKDELLSIVNHQLGGPITSIRWGLETFRDDTEPRLSEDEKQQIARLLNTTTELADLTNILLDLSRIELGRLSMTKRPTDLKPFFDDILGLIGVLAKEKNVGLRVDLPQTLPTANIDPKLTRMTLENLLNNAVKYTPSGGTVSFSVTATAHLLHWEVADTGCGIPKQEQELLFTKLFRASNVRDKIQGNGFGLYIAKGAIEQQGGTIRCDSTLGKGTTFTVEVPI